MTSVCTRQRGMTVPFLAVSIVAIFAIAALAIDLGVLYTARTSAQHAADAAALAGAYTFLSPAASQPDAATNAAIQVAAQNSILGDPVSITAANVVVDETNHRVTVTVPRTGANGILTYFAPVIGWQSVDVITEATAEAGLYATASRCVKPIFMPNTILSSADPAVACSSNQVIFKSDGTYSDWFKQYAASATPSPVYGVPLLVRPTNPQNALAPGQFYSLDFGSGGSDYRCTLGSCITDCGITGTVKCGDSFPLETGNMVGPTVQGVDDLIGNPADTWGGIDASGQYYYYLGGNTSTPVYSSRSVAIVPVWDNCSQVVSPGYHGQQVKIVGFASMFFEGMSGQWINVRFMDANQCDLSGNSGGGGSGGGTGPQGVPVRLVQTPTT